MNLEGLLSRPIDPEFVKWHQVLYLLQHDISEALGLCKTCTYVDAVWLNQLMIDVRSHLGITLAKQENDPRAMYMLCLFLEKGNPGPGYKRVLRNAANLGYVPAMYKDDPKTHFQVALEYDLPEAWARHPSEAGKARARLLGSEHAKYLYALTFKADQPDYYRSLLVCSKYSEAHELLKEKASSKVPNATLYAIGYCESVLHSQEYTLNKAYTQVYLPWSNGAKKAVHAWLLIGSRKGVVKDIRRMIGVMVWAMRVAWN